jgi:hypothetical protein
MWSRKGQTKSKLKTQSYSCAAYLQAITLPNATRGVEGRSVHSRVNPFSPTRGRIRTRADKDADDDR